MVLVSHEIPDMRHEDECGCRSSTTCADHLAETDLTLPAVPFGAQLVDARLSAEEATRLEKLIAAGIPRAEALAAIIEDRS